MHILSKGLYAVSIASGLPHRPQVNDKDPRRFGSGLVTVESAHGAGTDVISLSMQVQVMIKWWSLCQDEKA